MRIYKCIHTGKQYTCTYDSESGEHKFTDESGKKLKDYLACAFSGVEYKFPDNSVIKLSAGELISLNLTSTKPTHKKYVGFKKFTKIK